MDMSRKASGTPHPLVLSIWKGTIRRLRLVEGGGTRPR